MAQVAAPRSRIAESSLREMKILELVLRDELQGEE
jgi:hypothetical protein